MTFLEQHVSQVSAGRGFGSGTCVECRVQDSCVDMCIEDHNGSSETPIFPFVTPFESCLEGSHVATSASQDGAMDYISFPQAIDGLGEIAGLELELLVNLRLHARPLPLFRAVGI